MDDAGGREPVATRTVVLHRFAVWQLVLLFGVAILIAGLMTYYGPVIAEARWGQPIGDNPIPWITSRIPNVKTSEISPPPEAGTTDDVVADAWGITNYYWPTGKQSWVLSFYIRSAGEKSLNKLQVPVPTWAEDVYVYELYTPGHRGESLTVQNGVVVLPVDLPAGGWYRWYSIVWSGPQKLGMDGVTLSFQIPMPVERMVGVGLERSVLSQCVKDAIAKAHAEGKAAPPLFSSVLKDMCPDEYDFPQVSIRAKVGGRDMPEDAEVADFLGMARGWGLKGAFPKGTVVQYTAVGEPMAPEPPTGR